MSPQDCKSVLISWAAWVESGRPVPFNSFPPQSIIARFRDPADRLPPGCRPLWHGKMRSFWLADVDRLLRELPEQRLLILLAAHLPGKASDVARAADLGLTVEALRHTRRLAQRALERL